MQVELEPRHDPEVAAAAAQAPQQLGVLLTRSGTSRPSAVTTSAATRLSQASPNLRIVQPMPPPSVNPATPVVETSPPVVASP